MITQVELQCGEELKVYWLSHNPYNGQILTQGQKVRLVENDSIWTIHSLCISVPDDTKLPVKARLGTILQLN